MPNDNMKPDLSGVIPVGSSEPASAPDLSGVNPVGTIPDAAKPNAVDLDSVPVLGEGKLPPKDDEGVVSKAWDWATKSFVGQDQIVDLMGKQANFYGLGAFSHLKKPTESWSQFVERMRTTPTVSPLEEKFPALAGTRVALAGMVQGAAKQDSSFFSPVGIAMLAGGPVAGKVGGVAGKVIQAGSHLATAEFAREGLAGAAHGAGKMYDAEYGGPSGLISDQGARGLEETLGGLGGAAFATHGLAEGLSPAAKRYVNSVRESAAKVTGGWEAKGRGVLSEKALEVADREAGKVDVGRALESAKRLGIIDQATHDHILELSKTAPEKAARVIQDKIAGEALGNSAPKVDVTTTASFDGNTTIQALSTLPKQLQNWPGIKDVFDVPSASKVGEHLAKNLTGDTLTVLHNNGFSDVANLLARTAENHLYRNAQTSLDAQGFLKKLKVGYDNLDAGVGDVDPDIARNSHTVDELLRLKNLTDSLTTKFPQTDIVSHVINAFKTRTAKAAGAMLFGGLLGHTPLGLGGAGLVMGIKWAAGQEPVMRAATNVLGALTESLRPKVDIPTTVGIENGAVEKPVATTPPPTVPPEALTGTPAETPAPEATLAPPTPVEGQPAPAAPTGAQATADAAVANAQPAIQQAEAGVEDLRNKGIVPPEAQLFHPTAMNEAQPFHPAGMNEASGFHPVALHQEPFSEAEWLDKQKTDLATARTEAAELEKTKTEPGTAAEARIQLARARVNRLEGTVAQAEGHPSMSSGLMGEADNQVEENELAKEVQYREAKEASGATGEEAQRQMSPSGIAGRADLTESEARGASGERAYTAAFEAARSKNGGEIPSREQVEAELGTATEKGTTEPAKGTEPVIKPKGWWHALAPKAPRAESEQIYSDFKGTYATEEIAKEKAAKYEGGEAFKHTTGPNKNKWGVGIRKDAVVKPAAPVETPVPPPTPKVEEPSPKADEVAPAPEPVKEPTPAPVPVKEPTPTPETAPHVSEDDRYPEVKQLLEERPDITELLKERPDLTVKLVAGNLHIGEVRAERLVNEYKQFDANSDSAKFRGTSNMEDIGAHELAHQLLVKKKGGIPGRIEETPGGGAQARFSTEDLPGRGRTPDGVNSVLTVLSARDAARMTILSAGMVADEATGGAGANHNTQLEGSDAWRKEQILNTYDLTGEERRAIKDFHMADARKTVTPEFIKGAKAHIAERGSIVHTQDEVNDALDKLTGQVGVRGKEGSGDTANYLGTPNVESTELMKDETLKQLDSKDDIAKDLDNYTKGKGAESFLAGITDRVHMVGRAVEAAVSEARYHMKQAVSGLHWYTADLNEAMSKLVKIHPELSEPHNADLYKFIMAVSSSGLGPNFNIEVGDQIYNAYKRDGRIPTLAVNPDGTPRMTDVLKKNEKGERVPTGAKKQGQWSSQLGPRGLKTMQRLIDEKGVDGAVQWAKEQHPVAEVMKYSAKDSPWVKMSADADGNTYGSLAFGPKVGRFFQNLTGNYDVLTADRWFSRTWNRWMGTSFDVNKDGVAKMPDGTRNPKELAAMQESMSEAAKSLNINVAELQATLWYYEKALWRKYGYNDPTESYAGAVDRLTAKRAGGASEATGTPADSTGVVRDNAKGKTKAPGKNPRGKGRNSSAMNAAAEALGG